MEHGCYQPVPSGFCEQHRPDTTHIDRAKNARPHRQQNQKRFLKDCTTHALETEATCWLCGHHQQPPASKHATWHWHHITAGDPDSRQVETHSFCNMSFGDGTRWPETLKGVGLWRLAKIGEGKIREGGGIPV